MRIKSYFDSSIPTAMRQARHEFGDDVMLVTSQIASPEFRYLGDFEVVFAVDEKESKPKAAEREPPEPPVSPFGEPLQRAGDAGEGAIAGMRALLADMGLEPAIAEAMIGLIRSFSPRAPTQAVATAVPQSAVPLPQESAIPSAPVLTKTGAPHASGITTEQLLAGLEARLGIELPGVAATMRRDSGGGFTENGEAEALPRPMASGVLAAYTEPYGGQRHKT